MIAADLRRFGALVIAPVVAVLAACTPAASEPAPTPTPSPSPSQTPFAEKNAAAIEAYKRYDAMLVETAKAGGYGPDDQIPESVLATTMGDERDFVNQSNNLLKASGERVTGSSRLTGVTVTSSTQITGVPGGHRVKLSSCVDNGGLTIIGSGGERKAPARFIDSKPTLYYDDEAPAGWKVAEMESTEADRC